MAPTWEDADIFSEDDTAELMAVVVPIPGQSPVASPKRRLRVKPMSAGMRLKWPDVSSCLLTLDNGRQIMFVR